MCPKYHKVFLFLFSARLRGVHDGLFTGQIDAVDTLNATYRVTFDRAGLGTHTIPDYEVLVSIYFTIHIWFMPIKYVL